MSALLRLSPKKKPQKNSALPATSYKSYRKSGVIPKRTLYRWKQKYGDQILSDYLHGQGNNANKTKNNVSVEVDSPDESTLSFTTRTVLQETQSMVIMESSCKDTCSQQPSGEEQMETEQGGEHLDCPDPDRGSHQEPDEALQDSSDEEIIVEATEEDNTYDSDDPDSDCEDVCTIPKFKLVPILLLLKTKIRHGLTYTATANLIDLIKIYCKQDVDLTICNGLQVTSSSKKSAWPVLCTLNELPPNKRRKHILMSSLWLGHDKPKCNEYLRPLVNECLELATVGVDYTIRGNERNVKFRAAMCIADSVARPAIRNSTLFSGNFGCGLCEHPGEWAPKGNGGMMSYSPCIEEQWTGETNPVWYARRTHAQTMLDATEAETTGVIQRGIVGKSILTLMPWFDIINFVDVDVMHLIMNVGKTFCNLWFKSKNEGKPFYIRDKMNQVSSRLKSFHPTSEISRAPRSLDYYADFKAHEWAVWILMYSLVALKDILPTKYFEHWALLVSGLGRLTETSVRVFEVHLAKRELEEFVAETHTLYGMNCVSFNIHLLSHLPSSVKHFGNLWTHSAFLYESYNSVLKNSVHSSNGIINQIVMEFQTRSAVQFMESDLSNILSTEEKQYLSSLSTSQSRPNITKDLGFVQFFGKAEVRLLENNEFFALRREGVVLNRNVPFKFYSRCNFQDLSFQGTSYLRTVKKNNSVVSLTDGNDFIIQTFLLDENHNEVYCLGHLLSQSNQKICNVPVSHIWCVDVEERLRAVPLHNLVSKVIYLEIPNMKVCCRHPYEMEDLS